MSTEKTILDYVWDSPHMQAAFMDFAEKQGKEMPSLHSMLSDLTRAMAQNELDWFEVTADEQGPQFRLITRTHHEWGVRIDAMNQAIADRVSKRMLDGI